MIHNTHQICIFEINPVGNALYAHNLWFFDQVSLSLAGAFLRRAIASLLSSSKVLAKDKLTRQKTQIMIIQSILYDLFPCVTRGPLELSLANQNVHRQVALQSVPALCALKILVESKKVL